jgi:hypothetical protein
MAIKGQLARIERHLAKRGNRPITFIIPYSKDKQKTKEIQQRLIRENGLENKAILIIFVFDFAFAA